MQDHDKALAAAFDGQAAQFERAPVQTDAEMLAHLIAEADLPPDSLVLDTGCGPGLVCEALLAAGHRVVGVDLSSEMIARARKRCAPYGDRARFVQSSVFDPALAGPFDAAVSRSVLHHVTDPLAFVQRQAELVRPGGVLIVSDHTSDPDPAACAHHQDVERGRDRTHTTCLTPGALVDLLIQAGLEQVRHVERPFVLDFDEWFGRGTPSDTRENVRARMLTRPVVRGFTANILPDGSVRIDCWRSTVRGRKPEAAGSAPR